MMMTLRTLISCSCALAAMLTSSVLARTTIDVRGTVAADEAVQQALDANDFSALELGDSITVLGLPLDGRRVDLELERFDVWTPDGEFWIDDQPRERPGIVLLRGTVAGEPESSAVIGIGRHATNGYIRSAGSIYSLASAPADDDDAGRIHVTDLEDIAFDADLPACGVEGAMLDEVAPFGVPVAPAPETIDHDHHTRGTAPCRVARVAIDTDWEWTDNLFNGNAQASGEYAVFLIAAVSEIYKQDLNVRLTVPFVRTWSGNTDPYTGTASPNPLEQVRDHWRANMGAVGRETVHLLTGTFPSYGGVAYLSTLCSTEWGYGVSSRLNGSFPYPNQNFNGGNWDLYVVAHEIGHNFGAIHTHEFNPPLDNCGLGCTGNLSGTIMSYCHTCSGGVNNIALQFHPGVRTMIGNYLQFDAPCGLSPAPAAVNDLATTYQSVPASVRVLVNDIGPDCAPVDLTSVQSPTPRGGTAVIGAIPNPTGDPTGRPILYTPPPGFTGIDTFSYTTTEGQTALVRMTVRPLRPADTIGDPSAGLRASYYELNPDITALPDFSILSPISETLIGSLNFASTNGNPFGGPLADYMGAVFEGFVVVPQSGLYTFSLESDDGSRLLVGDQTVLDNDGLHGMQTVAGEIALAQGPHPIRIEYFEYNLGAGLIFRWTGPGVGGVVPLSALRHDASAGCNPADLVAPFGVLDLQDISAFVAAFVSQDSDGDFDANGVFDLTDITGFVSAFSAGCP